jgi:hypothetical protein
MNLDISISKKFFYDLRVAKRCNTIIDKVFHNPGIGLTTLFESSADTVGVWRFLNNSKFNYVQIMKSGFYTTKKTINKFFKVNPGNKIFVIQDTTTIDLTDNKASSSLGYLTDNKAFWHLKKDKEINDKTEAQILADFKKYVKKGVYLHSALACTTDGDPLGLHIKNR